MNIVIKDLIKIKFFESYNVCGFIPKQTFIIQANINELNFFLRNNHSQMGILNLWKEKIE
jgi:hypothetical protein